MEGKLSNKVSTRSLVTNRRVHTWFSDQECKSSRKLQGSFSSTSVGGTRTPTRVAKSNTLCLLAKKRCAPPPGAEATTDANATRTKRMRESLSRILFDTERHGRLDVCVGVYCDHSKTRHLSLIHCEHSHVQEILNRRSARHERAGEGKARTVVHPSDPRSAPMIDFRGLRKHSFRVS
jgi:hypothetical protein